MSWECAQCSALNGDNARFCRNCGAARPVKASMPTRVIGVAVLVPGSLLQQRYQIIREVAQGGQGTIYEASDTHTGRRVAIKALRLDAIASPDDHTNAVARIEKEAQILGRLNHPHIVQVLDYFRESEYPYVVMEYIEGQTLSRSIINAGGKLPETQAIYIARQLCSALAYLHAQNPPIVFRDLKPDNVMVDQYQNAKLIDFGIARRYRVGATADTQLFGSLGYAAPEQFGTSQSDARTDIYALGVTLFHMVTGRGPADNNDPLSGLPPVRSINPYITVELEDIITRATRGTAAQRWQSAEEMNAALGKQPTQRTTYTPHTVTVDGQTAVLNTNRPTTRLLLALARFSNTQIAIGTFIMIVGIAVLTMLLSNTLFPVFRDFPFFAAIPPMAYAATRRRWTTGLIQSSASVVISAALEYGLGGPYFLTVMLPRVLLGACVSGIAVEVFALFLLSRPATSGRSIHADWKPDALWQVVMGYLVVPAFYVTAFGFQMGLVPWLLAPILALVGWFIGDSIRQWNQVRALSQRHT